MYFILYITGYVIAINNCVLCVLYVFCESWMKTLAWNRCLVNMQLNSYTNLSKQVSETNKKFLFIKKRGYIDLLVISLVISIFIFIGYSKCRAQTDWFTCKFMQTERFIQEQLPTVMDYHKRYI